MKKIILLTLPLLLLLPACATVTRGKTTAWSVESTPSGAAVRTSNGYTCEATPCTFTIARKSGFGVTLTKDGYKSYTGQVEARVSGAGGAAMAGNLLVGGLIGGGIDASSGAMNDLYPNPLKVILAPIDSNAESVVAPEAPKTN
ncbi:MAG: translation initiation factor 2 subunit gamma GTPase [Hyphomonadaceae bacterium]|nr:MAG: translation initiation factor 2 subunit gamma GTPase [Hyphomonadaceae bacterium]KAF0183309.1 MAG: translation initiation factor 2 subunit gamma GTPase [Hyphomonadaceae bacterium]